MVDLSIQNRRRNLWSRTNHRGAGILASARLSIMQNLVFARSSVAVVIAGAVILVVAVVVANLCTGIGNADISPAGWLAMGFGVIVTLALGIGLMALVFISSRRGYDELGSARSTARRDESGV